MEHAPSGAGAEDVAAPGGPTRPVPWPGLAAAAAGAALFACYVGRTGVAEVAAGAGRLGWAFLAVAALGGLRLAARAFAWRSCLDRPHGLTRRLAFRATVAGDALGNLTPLGFFAGEPAKALFAADREPAGRTLAALAVENLFFTLSAALVVAGGAMALALRLGPADGRWTIGAALAGTLVLLIAAVHGVVWRRLHPASRLMAACCRLAPAAGAVRTWTGRVRRVERRVHGLYPRAPRRLAVLAGWELGFHALAVLEIRLVLGFVSDTTPTLVDAFVLESTNRLLAAAFKFVPLRLGVDEAGTAAAAGLLGFGGPAGVSLAIVRKARMLVWTTAGVALAARRGLLFRRRGGAEAASRRSGWTDGAEQGGGDPHRPPLPPHARREAPFRRHGGAEAAAGGPRPNSAEAAAGGPRPNGAEAAAGGPHPRLEAHETNGPAQARNRRTRIPPHPRLEAHETNGPAQARNWRTRIPPHPRLEAHETNGPHRTHEPPASDGLRAARPEPPAPRGAAVAVMARSPSRGRAPKTRLAGVLPAERDRRRLYAAFLTDVVAACRTVEGAALRIAYTPDGGPHGFAAAGVAGAELMPQRGAGLGDRERGVFEDLFREGFSPVVVIGSDLPGLPPERIREALDRLAAERPTAVLGPAADGGYYLIGLARPRIGHAPPDLFTGIRWNSAWTRADTVAAAERCGLRVALLAPWRDIDDAADFAELRTALAGDGAGRAPATAAVIAELADGASAITARGGPPSPSS